MLRILREPPILIATIDRPHRLNALDLESFREIEALVDEVNSDPRIRAVIFAADGQRAFSAGADINDLTGITPGEMSAQATWRRGVLQELAEIDVPSVAVVDGPAMGGGVELAMACTFRLATSRATFSMPEINLGLLPGAGATQRLPRIVGTARALEMMLTARRIGAEEALAFGLINRIVADPLTEARAFAAEWTRFSRTALRGILRATRSATDIPIHDGLALEGAELADLSTSADGLEGVAAFLEKRSPQFNKG